MSNNKIIIIKKMYHLPNNIIQLIYSFDCTYHQMYNQLKKEFSYVNSFWGLQFHNQSISETMTSDKMKATYKSTVELASYWNKQFLEANFMSVQNYNNWYTKNGVCSPIHFSDNNNWSKIMPILKANISSFKFLKKKNIVNDC